MILDNQLILMYCLNDRTYTLSNQFEDNNEFFFNTQILYMVGDVATYFSVLVCCWYKDQGIVKPQICFQRQGSHKEQRIDDT